MPVLPALSGRQVVRVFEKLGWIAARQRGSYTVMTKQGAFVSLSIPDHKEVAKGTLRSLIRLSGLTIEQFLSALN